MNSSGFKHMVLTAPPSRWGASGQGGDSFMRPHSFQLTWLVRFDFSVFVSVGRYFAAGKVSGASDNIR
jgi:hypothetical protein